MGSQLPDQGSNPHPLGKKQGVLTTGPIGKSELPRFCCLSFCWQKKGEVSAAAEVLTPRELALLGTSQPASQGSPPSSREQRAHRPKEPPLDPEAQEPWKMRSKTGERRGQGNEQGATEVLINQDSLTLASDFISLNCTMLFKI